jgi:hypothetical protein
MLVNDLETAKKIVKNKPIMVMEAGYPTWPQGNGWLPLCLFSRNYNVIYQSEYILGTAATAATGGSNGYFYFLLDDENDERHWNTLTEIENHWGLVKLDGIPKASFYTYQWIISGQTVLRNILTGLRSAYDMIFSKIDFFNRNTYSRDYTISLENGGPLHIVVSWLNAPVLSGAKSIESTTTPTVSLTILRPNGSFYGQWDEIGDVFEIDIPSAEPGNWIIRITYLNGGDDYIPLAVAAEIPEYTSPFVDAGINCTITTSTIPVAHTLRGVIADEDFPSVHYEWLQGSSVLNSGDLDTSTGGVVVECPITLSEGSHTFTLKSNDGENPEVLDSVTVTVRSETAAKYWQQYE